MRKRWEWLRTDPNLGKGLALLGITIVGFAAWAIFGDRGPDLNGRLVDADAVGSCLGEADPPASGWKVRAEDDQWGLTWKAEGERSSAKVWVLPNEKATRQLDGLAGGESPATTDVVDSFGNVIYHHSDGEEGPEVPEQVQDLIYDCLEEAATLPIAEVPGSFERCDDGDRKLVVDLRVRGMSCSEADEVLQLPGSNCEFYGPGFSCGSLGVGSTTTIHYAGDENAEIAFSTGI